MRRQWMLFAVAVTAWAMEVGLGLYLWRQIRGMRLPPVDGAHVWAVALAALAVAQVAGMWLWRRRLLEPARVAPRLAEAWREAGGHPPVPGEVATVAACRTVFVTDAFTWMFLQTIAIYGLVAMMVQVRSAPLLGFGGLALLLLLAAAPRRSRMLALAAALQPPAVGRAGPVSH